MTVTRDQRETLAHFTEAPELKIGSLFSGVGGLDLAVEEFFNARTVWHCEWEVDPSKVLAARWPGVPNHGDVTKLVAPEPVDILCGGFPCQDVSLAGRRRGMKDGTRSGLWSEFARLIDQLRPSWVFIENVRGLLSADATGDVEPCPWCLADGSGEHALRALGAVLGDLADLGFDAEWTMLRASDVGAPHGRPRIFILAWPAENTGSGRNGGGSTPPGNGTGSGTNPATHGADPRDDRRPATDTRGATVGEHPGGSPAEEAGAYAGKNDLIHTGGRIEAPTNTEDE